jgi:protein-tyrosine phosphatase
MKKHILIALLALPVPAMAQLSDSSTRLVHLQGGLNFRDVGGYPTNDGHRVATGKVYRSAEISKLSDSDLAELDRRHIRTVVDFRGKKESAAAPDRLLQGTDYTLAPAGSDSLPDMKSLAAKVSNGSFLNEFYTATEHFGARYRPLFQKLLAANDTAALLYHCTGGRDRTGMATALFLNILGVPRETIEADFVASNVYLKPMEGRMFQGLAAATGKTPEEVRDAFKLRPELLRSMFSAIEKKYGTLDAFYEQELGIGAAERLTLRKKYVI